MIRKICSAADVLSNDKSFIDSSLTDIFLLESVRFIDVSTPERWLTDHINLSSDLKVFLQHDKGVLCNLSQLTESNIDV